MHPYKLDIRISCTVAGSADIAWSNIYAHAANGLEQGVCFSSKPLRLKQVYY